MPYTINNSFGTPITTVADGTVDNTTSLKLIGKNYAGYGEIQNENFLFLLENFANSSAPARSIAGQIWFDTGNGKLKFNDGSKWRTTGGAEVGITQPTGLTVGDFWWDTQNKQLYASNGGSTPFTLIGPQGVAGAGTTQMRSRSVTDTLNNTHPIIEAIVNNQTVFVVSPDAEFTLNQDYAIDGFTKIQQGITLVYTNNDSQQGQTSSNHRFWGTATDSDRLGGLTANSFVQKGSALFEDIVNFSDAGYLVGSRLRVFNSGSTIPTIQNLLNDTIVFKTYVTGAGGGEKTPLKLVGPDLKPGSANTTDIGGVGEEFKSVYSTNFIGTATQANSLALGSGYTSASAAAGTGTIVARTSTDEIINNTNITAGAIKATYFVGTATAANYADLAENYLADAVYDIGTVVAIGGDKEVTLCNPGQRALGAVSEKPAYIMNSGLEGGTAIALKGRVPVKVTGPIIKGQRIVAGLLGTAQASFGNHADVFGIALESSDHVGVKLVECVIL